MILENNMDLQTKITVSNRNPEMTERRFWQKNQQDGDGEAVEIISQTQSEKSKT